MPRCLLFRVLLALLPALCLATPSAHAQDRRDRSPSLSSDHLKNGAITLRAFVPVAETVRESIVKLEVDGDTVALGTVIDANGLALQVD